MKIQHNISSYSVTWLANTYDKASAEGVIRNYYQPESLEEFTELCKSFYLNKTPFKIIGHTSNVYILPNTNIENLISTRYLNKWHSKGELCYCECGASVKQIVKSMVEKGVEGYACMIDLPGTVGAAIYGNAGVSHDNISDVLESVSILTPEGIIRNYSYNDLKFSIRSSALKRGELKGTILSCTLFEKIGNVIDIKKEAAYVHQWRLENQPGPTRNLGTTSLLSNAQSTKRGYIVRAIAKYCSMFVPKGKREQRKIWVILSLLGHTSLFPYLFGLNRYMWIDTTAHKYFNDYISLINQIYKNPQLEIEVW